MQFFKNFERNRVFTEEEGWLLFRIAAIAEACGWTLLIAGITSVRFITHSNPIPVQIAGQMHGVLFLSYALASIGLYPSLRWSRKRAFIALLASVPPYGSLLFERWATSERRRDQFSAFSCCIALATLSQATSN